MSYVRFNYPSKKAFKADVEALRATLNSGRHDAEAVARRHRLTIQDTAIVPSGNPQNGEAFIEGPHYPAPHRWYAKVQVTDGVVTKVLS